MAAVSTKPAPSVLGPSRKRLIQCTGTNPWDELYEALLAIRASLVRWCICNIWALRPGAVPPIVGGPAHTLRIFQTLIKYYIFSGMVHLSDQKLLNFLFQKKSHLDPRKSRQKKEKKRS